MTSTFGGENLVRDPVELFGPGPVRRIVYRRKLIQALNAKARAGKISAKEYRRIRRATYTRAFMDAFIDEVESAAKRAGDFLEDLQDWFQILVDWLIENWDEVLKIILTLLMFVI